MTQFLDLPLDIIAHIFDILQHYKTATRVALFETRYLNTNHSIMDEIMMRRGRKSIYMDPASKIAPYDGVFYYLTPIGEQRMNNCNRFWKNNTILR